MIGDPPRRFGRRAAAALLLGALHPLAFAPFGLWWLQTPLLAGLFGLAWTATPRQAAGLGAAFGSAWLGAGLWWLWISLHDFGGIPGPLAAVAVALLCAALSLYLALGLGLWARLRSGRALPDALALAACWLGAELLRAQALTGFPWLASGYAHTEGPLAPLAPWVGVYGLGAVAALAAALTSVALRPALSRWRGGGGAGGPSRREAGSALALLAVLLALPTALALLRPAADMTAPAGRLRVSLLQPNVPQDLKFDPDHVVRHMQALAAQVAQAQGQLVVTPESVLPLARTDLDPSFWDALAAPFMTRPGEPRRAALVGTFTGDDAAGYVNSLVAVTGVVSAAPDGGPAAAPGYVYGKRHLLPFGEYTPPGFRWLVALMGIPMSDQGRGRQTEPFDFAGQRLRPLICYEDLFGEDFAASATGPQAATVFVNASNFAWFGPRMVQDQHLQFSRMRALEFQRPFVRATNTGATTVIDHQGTVTGRLPALQRATLEAEVEGRQGATPYARWLAAAGLWPLWAVVFLPLLAVWRLGRVRKISRFS